ncbi:MAG TPA: hypothetical protein VK670_13675 [Silvibacterium sp.]|nr:hypothetical protein [Silvibacterium sp.]
MAAESISLAVSNLRRFPHLSNDQIFWKLVGSGVDKRRAARLVEFVPVAYSRLLLGKLGVRFSNSFQRAISTGMLSEKQSLSSDPVWHEVVRFATADVEQGIAKNDLLAIAGRSAEFDAVNQLLNNGSRATDLVLSTIQFQWPEDGPR